MKSNKKWRLRAEFQQWLATNKFDHFITFNLNHQNDFGLDRRAKIDEWFKRVNRKLLGRKWYTELLGEIEMIAFVEHPETNVHYHCFTKGTEQHSEFQEVAVAVWQGLVPGGQCYVLNYDNAPTGTSYVTKELFTLDNYEKRQIYPKYK